MGEENNGGLHIGSVTQSGEGSTITGDTTVAKEGGVVGDNAQVTNTFGGSEADPTWDDVTEEIGDDEAGKAHVMGMQAATEGEELTDQQVDIIKDGLAWMKIQSPNALRVAAEVIKKGPAGGTAKVMEMIADYVEQ